MNEYIVRHKTHNWRVRMPIEAQTLRHCGIEPTTGQPMRHSDEFGYVLRPRFRNDFCTQVQIARSLRPGCRPGDIGDLAFSDLVIRPMRDGMLAQLWRRLSGY